MGRGYSSSRDLEYRVLKNIRIKYTIGDVTRKAKYTGEGNMVVYRDERLSVNKFCQLVKKELIPNGKSNVNVWVSAYVSMIVGGKKKNVYLKHIPILSEYKKYENDILNNKFTNNDLKRKHNNDSNSKNTDFKNNMPRGKSKVNANISRNPPHLTKEQKETERLIREFDIKMGKWWNAQPKQVIEDLDVFTKAVFATRKMKGEDNVYEMLNQNKQRMGIVRPWIDKDGKYPPKFKNEDNVVTLNGEPEYEYILDIDCPFHEMPRSTYYKYRFTKVFEKFILTDEIYNFKSKC